ncbi:hypothetical protein SNE40_013191 [Patella caerulea]|uniref:Uncharacterized protein n=1 Tax=Patella caerulea TaxID=87958 RepID=A0AAN8JHN4_PATCE
MVKTRRSSEEHKPAHVDKPPVQLGISKTAAWRMKLKEDPAKYQQFLMKERNRNKRRLSRSLDEIKQDQQKSNQRLKEWRNKRKKPTTIEKVVFHKKLKDMTAEEKKEYFRIRQTEYRKSMTPQKKAKVVKRQRNYRLKKKKQMTDISVPNENGESQELRSTSIAGIRVISH